MSEVLSQKPPRFEVTEPTDVERAGYTMTWQPRPDTDKKHDIECRLQSGDVGFQYRRSRLDASPQVHGTLDVIRKDKSGELLQMTYYYKDSLTPEEEKQTVEDTLLGMALLTDSLPFCPDSRAVFDMVERTYLDREEAIEKEYRAAKQKHAQSGSGEKFEAPPIVFNERVTDRIQ